jgi:hypothetical protein
MKNVTSPHMSLLPCAVHFTCTTCGPETAKVKRKAGGSRFEGEGRSKKSTIRFLEMSYTLPVSS